MIPSGLTHSVINRASLGNGYVRVRDSGLVSAVTQFLCDEAALLDEWRLDEWLTLFHAEGGRPNLGDIDEAIDLGNGHAAFKARGPWARPVARWTPGLGEPNRARVEAAYAELVRKHGPERAELIGRVDRVVRIFPNLIILDLMGVVVRKITPTAAGHTKITQWSLATAGEDADMRARRLDNFLLFQGPGGFATPDDLEALEACQAGYRAGAGVPWSDVSRGMHREHGGQSCRNSDELHMRAFWRRWQTLMSA